MGNLLTLAQKVPKKIKFILRRQKSIRELYIYPETQDGWVKHPIPLIGNKNTGSFFDPYIYCENGTFFLFVSDDSRASTNRSAFLGSVILTCVKMLEVAIVAPPLATRFFTIIIWKRRKYVNL